LKIAAYRGNSFHAPENSFQAFISAYTNGANALDFQIMMSADKNIVISNDESIERLTGKTGLITDMTLFELQNLNFAKTFQPRNSKYFTYDPYPSSKGHIFIETLTSLLDKLPPDIELLIQIENNFPEQSISKENYVEKIIHILFERQWYDRIVIYSSESSILKLISTCAKKFKIKLNTALMTSNIPSDLEIKELDIDGIVIELQSVMDSDANFSEMGNKIKEIHNSENLKLGAILHVKHGTCNSKQYSSLINEKFAWFISIKSMFDISNFAYLEIEIIKETFSGKNFDTKNFALGYAKSNKYAKIYQNDGIHLEIDAYDKPLTPPPHKDDIDKRLLILENQMTYALKNWQFYSGGGIGFVEGIAEDFVAEVDYSLTKVAQGSTLEMAVVNVDPARYPSSPSSPSTETSPFYDPHGCPPYIGVEHDEDDGFRINWNLGTGYDDNQYGAPVADGKSPRSATLRLERRGNYFSAYYRNPVDVEGKSLEPKDWVCVGVKRNDSLNPVVYLRCAAKRWRHKDRKNPEKYLPVIQNHFKFKNLKIIKLKKIPESNLGDALET